MLWAILSTSYGLSHLFFENVYNIPTLINTAKLDIYISQPIDVLWNVAISKTNILTFGDLLYGTVLALISVKVDLYSFLCFVAGSLLGGVILTAFSVIVGSFSFWTKKGEQIAYCLDFTSLTIGTYPEGVFNGLTRIFLYALLPVGFAFYTPLKAVLQLNFSSLLIMFFVATILTLLASYVFHKGLQKYSSGNF